MLTRSNWSNVCSLLSAHHTVLWSEVWQQPFEKFSMNAVCLLNPTQEVGLKQLLYTALRRPYYNLTNSIDLIIHNVS